MVICAGEYHSAHKDRLRTVLDDATDKMSRTEILKAWSSLWDRPSERSLHRWLERAVRQGLLCHSGTGRKSDPFRYWLPGKVEKWRDDPCYLEELPELEPLEPLEPLELPEHYRGLSEREHFKRAKKEVEGEERGREKRRAGKG